MDDFASLLAEFEDKAPKKGPKVGDFVKGVIISMSEEFAFVDLGGKAEGMVEVAQLRDADGALTKAVGDQVEASVVSTKGGSVTLACKMGRGANIKQELAAAYEHQLPIEGLVSAVNKGGFEISIAGERAFCPMSKIDTRFVEVPETFLGKTLEFLIAKLEIGRNDRLDLVVSRRDLLERENAVLAEQVRENLQVGAILTGTVSTLKPYGAFVDLGGLEGMIHISEMAQGRISDPSEILTVGEKVQVMVQKIQPPADSKKTERIALSLKALEKSPWEGAIDRYPVNTKVPGTVVRLQPFGAFVELEKGLEGLVHISEFVSDKRINHPREVVKEGEEVSVRVVSVDPGNQRLSLSMKESSDPDSAMAADIAAHKRTSSGKGLGTFGDLLAKSQLKSK